MSKRKDSLPPSLTMNRRKFLKTSFGLITASLLATPGYSFFLERFWVETTQLSLKMSRLPHAFNGLRIVQISDLHLGFYYDVHNLEGIVRRVNQLNPDLICFTGDLVHEQLDGIEKSIPVLKKLNASLGKVAIFGNHDFRGGDPARVQATLEKSDFHFLKNSHMTISRGKSALHIAGLDDLFGGHPDGKKALKGIPRNGFTLLLAHEPDLADWKQAVPYPVDLMLSGHSHGGQIRVPFLGALYRPDGAKHYIEGLKTIGQSDMKLYVNRGIGTTYLPFRFNCRPEMTLFILRS
ncbi:metallophosphoesterase [Pullulanibacillus sp. KACC 23026]|uniref:metallophosphoesterase n=1 Tax=Pullulanibacillus sp. KACC 23026 TaxID=3028315 RepID=UPI0023B016F7|nr:metallophosphoesterase [Pullulanibacillus sp. KACC 23026]WEG11525.1 metallophosphoesterase [Pullulanibacillus sp. KACC 23026]